MTTDVSRRGFLLGTAALGTSLLAGASMLATAQTAEAARLNIVDALDPEEELPEPTQTYDCDFLVCGSGTAGLCAAVHAAELGAEVILVDTVTENGVGGNSRYVENLGEIGGDGAMGSGQEAADNYYKDLVTYHRHASNERVTRRFADTAEEVINWTMNEVGTKFTPGRLKYEEDEEGTNGGKVAIYDLYNYGKELGVTFLFDNRAKKLLTDDDGAVIGALCESRTGDITQVNAKAVDLCTGGYSANAEMFEQFTHLSYDRVIPRGTMGTQMGDGLTMGMELGALLHHPEAINYCSPILPGHYNKGALTICGVNQADTVFLNETGRRFCDESVISDWTLSGNIGSQQHHIYVLVDQDYVDKIATEGVVTRRANYFEVGDAVPEFQDEIDKALERPNPRVYKGDTLAEIAKKLDLDPDAVEAEIELFNSYVDAGYDHDFLKDPKYLRKVQTPPFYGFRTQLAFYNTCGGLKVDEYARVIGSDYKPIPGLYAGGSDAGALFGPYYDVSVAPGSTQLWGRVSGYWAAEHAINEYIPSA